MRPMPTFLACRTVFCCNTTQPFINVEQQNFILFQYYPIFHKCRTVFCCNTTPPFINVELCSVAILPHLPYMQNYSVAILPNLSYMQNCILMQHYPTFHKCRTVFYCNPTQPFMNVELYSVAILPNHSYTSTFSSYVHFLPFIHGLVSNTTYSTSHKQNLHQFSILPFFPYTNPALSLIH